MPNGTRKQIQRTTKKKRTIQITHRRKIAPSMILFSKVSLCMCTKNQKILFYQIIGRNCWHSLIRCNTAQANHTTSWKIEDILYQKFYIYFYQVSFAMQKTQHQTLQFNAKICHIYSFIFWFVRCILE